MAEELEVFKGQDAALSISEKSTEVHEPPVKVEASDEILKKTKKLLKKKKKKKAAAAKTKLSSPSSKSQKGVATAAASGTTSPAGSDSTSTTTTEEVSSSADEVRERLSVLKSAEKSRERLAASTAERVAAAQSKRLGMKERMELAKAKKEAAEAGSAGATLASSDHLGVVGAGSSSVNSQATDAAAASSPTASGRGSRVGTASRPEPAAAAPPLRADKYYQLSLFTADEFGRILLELLTAVAELHKAGTVHGDIKPANVSETPKNKTCIYLELELLPLLWVVLDSTHVKYILPNR